jgi:hypothetical protein
MRSFMICNRHRKLLRVEQEHGGRAWEEMRTGFWWRNLKEDYYVEDLVIDGRIILKWTGFIWVSTGDNWRAGVNTVMNFRVPQIEGNLMTS